MIILSIIQYNMKGLRSTMGALAVGSMLDSKLNDRCGHNQLVVLEEPRWDSRSQSNIHANKHYTGAPSVHALATHTYTHIHTLSVCVLVPDGASVYLQ